MVTATGVLTEPEGGMGPESSLSCTGGIMVTEVALVVTQVSVVICPALSEVGLAVNCVICGGATGATCTCIVCGALVPPGPVATAL